MPLPFSELLRKSPFIRLTVPLLLGIVCGECGLSLPFHPVYLVAALVLAYLVMHVAMRKVSYFLRWLWGVPIFVVLFFSGLALWQQQKHTSDLPVEKDVLLNAVVVENPVQKANSVQLRIRVDGYRDSVWHSCNEKVVLYVQADSIDVAPTAGQRLLIAASLQAIKAPSNPEEFDYQKYMQRRGYFATAFVTQQSCRVVDSCALNSLQLLPLKAQQSLSISFREAGIEGQELAVLMALTIGDKQLLDDEVREAYTSAGVIHVLAVSGLHVGLLFMLLSAMLFFLNKKRYGRILKAVLIFIALWIFAAIAGFSPSVVRAVVMFSFVLLGQLLGRESVSLNSVAASAFFICLFSPLSIFSVGFQLSYLAIIGIIAFYPKLSSVVAIKNPILKGAYQLCCISLAAQVAVLPLTIFYFHQQPLYFLPANLLVIPLVTIASYLIVALLLVSWIPLLSTLVGSVLSMCLSCITYIVSSVQQLPFAVWDGIYLSPPQLALCMPGLLALLLLMAVKKRALVWAAAICVILVLSLGVSHHMETAKQRQLAIFNVGKASYLMFVEGHSAVCIRDSANAAEPFDYNLNGYFAKLGLTSEHLHTVTHDSVPHLQPTEQLHPYKGFLWFSGCSIKLLTSKKDVLSVTEPIPIDLLVVTSAFKPLPADALSCYSPQKVILDSSLSKWRAERWVEALQERGIPFHYVKEQGAFILELP